MKIATHERADTIANGDNIKCGPYDDVGHRQAWQACSQLRIDCEEAWPSREKGRLLLETVAGRLRLLLRNSRTGGLEVYDINNNQITGAALIGTVGLDWQFAGIGPVHGAGESDLVFRNKKNG